MNMIPTIVAKFLSLPEKEGFTIYDKFAYIIKSIDGDEYYFQCELPNAGYISEEFSSKLYKVISEDIDYEDVFNWFLNWET